MRFLPLRELKINPTRVLRLLGHEDVIVTRRGQPAAALVGLDHARLAELLATGGLAPRKPPHGGSTPKPTPRSADSLEVHAPSAGSAFQARWTAAESAEIQELRSTPADLKLRQTAALMASVDGLGWSKSLASEEAVVRDRWRRLRKGRHA